MKNNDNKKIFNYIIIFAVMLIPFMYSFFYLKAYWDPYGKGNIDNIPVAIVNEDKGDKGEELINSIVDSGKLKLSIVSKEKAEDGLYDGTYYALISIPSDFTESMKSAGTASKKHAQITYSANQKTNYLSSQIINTVVLNVEKSLDNSINSEIISNLTNTLSEVPSSLETISNGFDTLKGGISKLNDGSNSLNNGLNSLKTNYELFNQGVSKINKGLLTLNDSTSSLDALSSNLGTLIEKVDYLDTNNNTLNTKVNSYILGVNNTLSSANDLSNLVISTVCPKLANGTASEYEKNMCLIAKGLLTENEKYDNKNIINYLTTSGESIRTYSNQIASGIDELNTKVGSLNGADQKLNALKNGINELSNGAAELNQKSNEIKSGIDSLASGSNTLNECINTLYNGVSSSKDELDSKISSTKEDLKKLDGLTEYSKEPVIINTDPVNEITSYGTAFSPLFISIALWVGCLMMYIVLYYDKDQRFKKLGICNTNRVQRTLLYHALASITAILLGILLAILLDFKITNIWLYFLAMILTSNLFMGIIEFLIINFKDIGKFVALIILVLQLAAAGGTFPIETVTSGFRWLNGILPMTYTIRLIKETIITIESALLIKNLMIVLITTAIFFGINLSLDFYRQKNNK